ncbi:MAG TPA: hypothetical protein VIX89_02930 [Bryobacteraceae bacterium]
MKKFAKDNRWLLLAFFSAMIGLQMSTPAYAGGMSTVTNGKTTSNNGQPACDCRTSNNECFCNT